MVFILHFQQDSFIVPMHSLDCLLCFNSLVMSFFFHGRQEAAGALWNLSFDDRNREAIAAAGGVEALVCFYRKRF